MKFAVRLILLIFVIFLSTPTIVGMIKKGCDTSVFYTMSEEELVHKDVKLVVDSHPYELVFLLYKSTSAINSECFSKHDNISAAIFIPPPELA